MSLGDELRHDTSALFQFIQRITAFCEEQRGPQAYNEASHDFFEYLRTLGNSTLVYLDRFADSMPSDDALYYAYRQKLWNLRANWSTIHRFIRPAREADTLRAPTPLIQALTTKLSEIPGFAGARFAVFHTDELNYLHLDTNAIRALAQKLGGIIPNGPSFPAELGLIGLPYSQGASFFLNLLLAHEIGHYVYQRKRDRGELADLETKLVTVLQNALKPIVASLTPIDVKWCEDRLRSWSQELFCDLFAVGLIGPAYTFAYVEIFDLSLMLDPTGNAVARASAFSQSHPADAFRLREQCLLLEENGWSSVIKDTKSHYPNVLARARSVSNAHFFSPSGNPKVAKESLEAFITLTPEVHRAISNTLGAVDSRATEFTEFKQRIRDHLVRGIVPSTIVVGGDRKYPGPVALINAAYQLYLEAMDELIGGVADQDQTSIRVRSVWVDRLERWILKALEDNHLLKHQKSIN